MYLDCVWGRGAGLKVSFEDGEAFDEMFSLALRDKLALTSCGAEGCITRDMSLLYSRPDSLCQRYGERVRCPKRGDVEYGDRAKIWLERRRSVLDESWGSHPDRSHRNAYVISATTRSVCYWPVEVDVRDHMTPP